jgi:hypothetical protein
MERKQVFQKIPTVRLIIEIGQNFDRPCHYGEKTEQKLNGNHNLILGIGEQNNPQKEKLVIRMARHWVLQEYYIHILK